jgi:uncharacterized protein YhaN
MRLARLDLKAFGSFTDVSLDFSSGAPGGLHVVYGANEAGKSTALRAVRDLLYGFEHRTRDGYLHSSEELRIGGLLEGAEGELYVQRVKRRKDSLLDAEGAPLDEARLKRLLGGIDRDTFTQSFGLGHAELEAQGERLLRGESSIGETLFDAGTGGIDVRRLLAALESEQEKLYLVRGKQQEMNRLLDEYAKARLRSQEVWLLPETFQKQAEELAAARAELGRVTERVAGLRTEQHRVRDLKQALPALRRRAECLTELAELGQFELVSEADSERRERAEAKAAAARAAIVRLEDESERSARRLAELEVPNALLAIGQSRVARLSDAPGRTRKAREDLPRREADLKALESQARASLVRLGRADAPLAPDEAKLSTAERGRIHGLATERDKLDERLVRARERRSAIQRELDERRARLGRLPEPSDDGALERVAALARGLGDVEQPVAELEAEQAELGLLAEQRLRSLRPEVRSLAELEALAAPALETLARFAAGAGTFAQRASELDAEAQRLRARAAETRAAIQRIEATGDVPSETELARARGERDAMLGSVLGAWREGTPFDRAGAEALGTRVEAADGVSDRLRREAGRVTELAHARAEAALAEEQRAELATRRAELDSERALYEVSYQELWSGAPFRALPPEEMRVFLEQRARILELVQKHRALEPKLVRARADRERLRAAVTAALGPSSSSDGIALGVERAAELSAGEARLSSERQELVHALDGLEARAAHEMRELEAAEAALAEWQAAWGSALAPLGAEPTTAPVVALELCSELTTLAGYLKDIEGLSRRVKGIRRDEAELSTEVGELARTHDVPFDPAAPDAAAEEIVARFRRAEAARAERERLEAEALDRGTLLDQERALLAEAERELDALSTRVGAASPRELPALEAKSRRARELKALVAGFEATLLDDSGGRSVAALVAETEHHDAPELAARLDELSREIEELEDERGRAMDRAASLAAGQRRQSDADGAEAAQEEQTVAAALTSRYERYATLRVATALLERAIERYRVENQGPILKRAGEIFPRLTGDRYRGLRVAREGTKIVAVRADGTEVTPDGLSEGASYQLYLALRLASVERFIAGAEPLPLVLDDATIHFDEVRKRATFAVLGELAERVQILFFTHNERDPYLALEATEGRAVCHELTRAEGSLGLALH